MTNLNYDTNGYSIIVQYYDHSTCFSWSEKRFGCQQTCQEGTDIRLFYKSTADNKEKFIKIDLIPKLSGKPRSCPIHKGVDDFQAEQIAVDVYNCEATRFPRQHKCNLMIKSLVLPKDKLINLNHEVNGYSTMVKFYGQYLCGSLREYHINETSYRCRKKCDDMFEKSGLEEDNDIKVGSLYISYERVETCEGKSCVEYGRRYLRFLNITSFTGNNDNMARQNPFLMALIMLCSSMLIKLMTG